MVLDPKVHVLILNWNGKSVLKSCVDSIKKSSYNNYVVTIIDNGSKDGSINEYFNNKDIGIIKINKNLGYARGYNYGFKKIFKQDDDCYLILNNDTILLPNTIKNLVECYKKNGNKNLYSPKILNLNNNKIWYAGGMMSTLTGLPYHIGIDENESKVFFKTKKTLYVTGCCMLINKEIITLLHGFNERYKMYFEDVDFCVRAKKYNSECYYVSDSIVYHNVSYSSGGRFSIKKNIAKVASFIRFLFLNNGLFLFLFYFILNILFTPFYFLKLFLKKKIYE